MFKGLAGLGWKTLLGMLFVSVALTACAQSSRSEAVGRYSGVLRLKGSAPMFHSVLIEPGGKEWELTGLERDTAIRLQNRRIEVEAVPAAVQREPGWPRLQVRSWRVRE